MIDSVIKEQCAEILARELPVLRKMNNLSQQDFGEIIGVSRQTITNIESGRSKMQWTIFLAAIFIFSLDSMSDEYLKNLNIPYQEIKEWLIKKRL